MSKSILCGLDIGTSKVCCAIAEQTPQQAPVVRGVAWTTHRGIREGHVIDLSTVTDAIHTVLDRAEADAGITIRQCAVGISVPQLESRCVRGLIPLAEHGTAIRGGDMERVRAQAELSELAMDRTILHSIPLNFSIDGDLDVDDPRGLVGHRLAMRLRLLTCPDVVLQNVTKAVQLAGLEVQQFVYGGLAAALALLTPTLREQQVLVIDVGDSLTDIVLMREGQLFSSATIACGGRMLTDAIAHAQHIPSEEAEAIKRAAGLARDRAVDEVLTRAAITLLQRMAQAMQPLRAEVAHIDAVLVTGRTALLDGFLELAEAQLGHPVQLGRVRLPKRYVGREPSVLAATAVGLTQRTQHTQGVASPPRGIGALPHRLATFARELYDEYF